VPVILIFTKFESQEAIAFKKLMQECPAEEAMSQAAEQARHDFDQAHLSRFRDRKYPPKEILYLKDMDKEGAQCSEIIELTTIALGNATLKWLFVTVQQTNLKLRIERMFQSDANKKALRDYMIGRLESVKFAKYVWRWYFHLFRLVCASAITQVLTCQFYHFMCAAPFVTLPYLRQ